MKFKVGSKVFYPSHGAGYIKRKKEIEFDGKKKEYFEFELVTNPLSISTPIDNVENLGIRDVMPVDDLKKIIKILKKTPNVNPKVRDFNMMIKLFKELEESPNTDASIQIIQYCNYVKDKRKKEGRLIPITLEKQLEAAIANLVGELAVSSDISLKDASDMFSKLSGIKVDVTKE
ncbi:MAG: CarD family transcriptional regulator [Candidatus Dojkabacteria bacterium]|jgi:CarD family transcriptional regulator